MAPPVVGQYVRFPRRGWPPPVEEVLVIHNKGIMGEGKKEGDGFCHGAELTRIHPLHAIGECVVGDEVIASPAGVGDDGVCGG